MDDHVRVVTVSRVNRLPWQFVVGPGEVLVIGRAQNSDIHVESRGVSARHAELSLVPPKEDRNSAAAIPICKLFLRDRSTNGTGFTSALGVGPWKSLRDGQGDTLASPVQVLVPLNCKAKDASFVLTIGVVGDALPDAYDDRTKTGRWRYHRKLGEGALGIVYCATDTTGVFPGDVAIKMSKVAPDAKISSRMRNAYILHREAQWSIQRLHNPAWPQFNSAHASLFVQYFEDHTGCWANGSTGFDAERAVFEAASFSWDKFEPASPLPTKPYVAMELVPGKTLHSTLGWGQELAENPPLAANEKLTIAKQSTEALQYLVAFGLVHRDFRTTNIMLTARGNAGRIRIIDLGHTIAADEEQKHNKSAVVRCNWKESKGKRFDWAPVEVKDRNSNLNFTSPVHAFDVFSLGVFFLQLESGSIQVARQTAIAFLADGHGPENTSRVILREALGLQEDMLRRMLGEASARPHPVEVLQALRAAHQRRDGSHQLLEGLHPKQMPGALQPPAGKGCDRQLVSSRSRSPAVTAHRRPKKICWQTPDELELVDDNYEHSAAGYVSPLSGSDTEPEEWSVHG